MHVGPLKSTLSYSWKGVAGAAAAQYIQHVAPT
jgi:hypothetical protein